jgi:hypothetical protein
LNAGVWFRRGRLLMVSPVRSHLGRCQAETPLIPLSRFAEPALRTQRACASRVGAVANVVGIRREAVSGNMKVSSKAARSIG